MELGSGDEGAVAAGDRFVQAASPHASAPAEPEAGSSGAGPRPGPVARALLAPEALRFALLLGAALAALAFALAAGVRRLNFDESLALRAGWLLVEGVDGEPAFAMPITLAIGALAHAVEDPGRLFLLLRGLAAASVLGALAWMLQRARLGAAAALAVALVSLLQAAFAVHAYEFRYDWAILLGWMIAFGLLQRRAPLDYAGLGACVAWIGAHHLKGLFFAVALYAFALAALAVDRGAVGRKLAGLHAGALATGGAWLLLTVGLGHGDAVLTLYAGFAELAAAQPKVWPWSALGPALARDALWWAAAVLALLGAPLLLAHEAKGRLGALRDRPEAWALAFAAVPIAFLFAHPHPWPYMLAPAAPFVAILVVYTVRRLAAVSAARGAAVAAGLVVAVALQGLALGVWPGTPYAAALRASSAPQVASLRLLRRAAAPGERAIDPSGLAYFQPPCTEEWYVDSLFRPAAQRGDWMSALAAQSPEECPWVVNTYRLGWLPAESRTQLPEGYARLPGGLALARGDARLDRRELWPQLRHDELRSFWW